jgi:3-hydroxyacyl-[acyl-carrier-protein] dehydratase
MNNEMLVPEIKEHQQNRHPLLFVDKITDLEPGKSCKGVKAFSYNEWFFPAHFEDDPNVPGFIQIECLVQVLIMCVLGMDEYKGEKTNFLRVNEVAFRRKITPGDVLLTEATLESFKRGIASGTAIGSVDGELAVSGKFTFAIPSVLQSFTPKK